jgi:hypothetical protein
MGFIVILLTYCQFRGYHLEIGSGNGGAEGAGEFREVHSRNAALFG